MKKRKRRGLARPIAIALAVLAMLAAVSYYMALAGGYFATETSLLVDAEAASCDGKLEISIESRDSDDRRLPDALVDIYVDAELADSLYTDRNGMVMLDLDMENGWCGKDIVIRAEFGGDEYHLASSGEAMVKTRAPTAIMIEMAGQADAGEPVNVTVSLADLKGNPLEGKTVLLDGMDRTTDAEGRAVFGLNFTRPGIMEVSAAFEGDDDFESSEGTGSIEIYALTCDDGTLVGGCSGQHICTEEQVLEFDCESCGCPQGLLCIDNQCISEEERIEALVKKLQKSTALVRSDDGLGSGVIIEMNEDETIILTNRHVVDEDFDFVISKNLEVENYLDEVGKPYRIYIAPNDLDLAAILVKKQMGPPADVAYNATLNRGAEVLAMGAPLGIQNSVSKGIISNFFDTETRSEYEYQAIQTDAAVNPGNSGGGVFLVKNGELIGITTFKLVISKVELAEGLGFAVPVSLLEEFPLDTWRTVSPD